MRKRKRKSSNLLLIIYASIFAVISLLYYKYQSPYVYTGELKIKALPDSFKSYGIDISHHQGEIDWSIFKDKVDSTIRFVYCKATEGTNFIDKQWSENRKQLQKLKIVHGAYHFFSPKKPAKIQATHFLNQYSYKQNDLPPVLDSETEGSSDKELISKMKIWLTEVEEKTGKRP